MKGYLYRLNAYFKNGNTPYYIWGENKKILSEKLKDIPNIKIVERIYHKKCEMPIYENEIEYIKENIKKGNLLIIK